MVDVINYSEVDEVVENDSVPLTDVDESLMIVEVMLDHEGLDVRLGYDVCPADDVVLLDDDIIEDGDVF